MRYRDILTEEVQIRELIERVSAAIPSTLHGFVAKMLQGWRRTEIRNRRVELGYDAYADTREGYRPIHGKAVPADFKPFDQDAFDRANRDWTPDDAITEQIEELIPPISQGQSNPVYAAMGSLSKSLTSIVQDYVRQKFGDPIPLRNRTIEVPVSDVKVQVWWTEMQSNFGDNMKYGGVYRSRTAHANGPQTRLEIVVSRESWRQWLIDAVYGEMGLDAKQAYQEFSEIVNTFAHEYAHFEQDIKGQKNYTYSLIPQKGKGRHSEGDYDPNNREKLLYYYARPAEIDAMATGAAAQVVQRIMRKFHNIDARIDDWNQEIRYEMAEGIHSIPFDEYSRYIQTFNRQLSDVDNKIKAKFLHKVKQRFLRTYYKRLSSYLR